MITKDKKYYEAFSSQLDEWLKSNSYSYGANYKCGQEAALRMINALIAYSVFQYNRLVTQNDEANLSELVRLSYKKILSNIFYAHKCIKNNHAISEITGLIIGAWCCEDKIRMWKAYKLLDEEIKKQFFFDGGYIQYSFNYQRFALQLIECLFKISEKTNIHISERSKEVIKKSVMLMYQMQDESGDMPNYGSNDGALIFPVSSCCYRDFRPVLNTVYHLITRKNLYEPGDYDEEILWFANKKIDNTSVSIINRMPMAFKKTGLYSLRHDNGFVMIVLQDYKTRPAQMDGLHIDLWYKGINIFCDSGTYSYADDIGKEMAATAAHNTVQFNGKEQMKRHGPFMIYDWTSSRDVNFNHESFTGKMISKNGYEHTRSILKTNLGYLISDKVNGNGAYCDFYFHTPCSVRIVPGEIYLIDRGKVICTVDVGDGSIAVNKTYRSLYYLRKEEVKCVIVRCNMNNNQCRVIFNIRFNIQQEYLL